MNYHNKTKVELIKELLKLQHEYDSLKTSYDKDLTGRKQVEEDLKKNEALFREYYDNMKSGSAIFKVINDGSKGSDYIIKKFNRSGLKMEGKALEEVVGKRLIDIRPAIDSYGLIPVMKKVWETGESAIFPTTIYIDERYANYYENYVFKLPSGEVVTLYNDITENKKTEEALLLEKENFRNSLDECPLGIRIVNLEGDTIYANRAILDLYGFESLEELQKTRKKNRYTPESYIESQKRKKQRLQGDFSSTAYEISIVRKNGEIRQLQVFRNKVLWNSVWQFQIIYEDITVRKQIEEEIKRSEYLRSIILDNLPFVSLVLKKNTREIVFCNKLAIEAGAVIGKTCFETITNCDHNCPFCKAPDLWETGKEQKVEAEYIGRYWEGRWMPFSDDLYIHYILDITERKQAEEELRKSKKLLEDLYKHQIDIRENERALISREIHDELGQSMTALKLDLKQLYKYASSNPEAIMKLDSMNELVSNTIKDVQRIASDLRPGILDDLGLVSAIEWYCDEFEKRTGIICSQKLENSDYNDSKLNLTLFRALQETLTNVIRHARASSVNVRLHKSLKGTILTIVDNGIGIPEEKIESHKSLGLISMRERVKQFNGKFDISSKKDEGTKLTIFIPAK